MRSIRDPPRSATETQTSPTGFSSVPPSGPATPVMPTPRSAPSRAIAPSASARATSSETAPWASISAGSTPARSVFALFAYATSPPRTYAEAPGMSVSRAATRPPVQDSAVATVRAGARVSSAATCSSTVVPSSEKRVAAWRSRTTVANAS